MSIGAFSFLGGKFTKSSPQNETESEDHFKVEVRYRSQTGENFDVSNFYEEMPQWLDQEKFLAVRENFMKTGKLIEYRKKLKKKSFSIFYTFRSEQDYKDFVSQCRPFVNRTAQAALSFKEEAIFNS